MSSVVCYNEFMKLENPESIDQYDKCRFIIEYVLRTFDLVPAFGNTTTGQTDGRRHGSFPYQYSDPMFQKTYRFPVTLTHESDGPNGRFVASLTRVVSTDPQKKERLPTRGCLCYIYTSSLPTLFDVDRENDMYYKIPMVINTIVNAWSKVWFVDKKDSSSASTPASTEIQCETYAKMLDAKKSKKPAVSQQKEKSIATLVNRRDLGELDQLEFLKQVDVPTMHNFLIFLPEYEYESWKAGFLYGNIFHSETGTAIYILGPQLPDNYKYPGRYEKIGEIGHEKPSSTSSHWLFIRMKNGNIENISVIFEKLYNVRIVVYNRDHIKRSQWLDQMPFQENDFIFQLISDVKKQVTWSDHLPSENNGPSFRLTPYLLYGLQKIVNFSKNRLFAPFINISTFGVHFFNILESVEAIFNRFTQGQSLSIRDKNYISARMVDMLLGQIIIFYVMSHMSSAEMFAALSDFQEFVVAYLKNTVEWLMGSPAGFKLNCPLNNVLGPFYQFHISLWWTFLRLSKPLLWVTFHFVLFLGNFGLSLQVAILADVLAIVSVHIYCIYVYAARLYFFQMKGLKILSRLFIGKKRNPLPGTEHSSPYTTEQLLFGTVSFTILLFLLPTTLIYYFVFTAIRIVIILLGGIFTRVRHLMMAFPIYVTWLWFYDPVCLTCTVRLSNKMRYLPDGTLVTKIKPICESWWWTVQMNTVNCIPHTAAIEWKKLTTDVLVGNLIYPV